MRSRLHGPGRRGVRGVPSGPFQRCQRLFWLCAVLARQVLSGDSPDVGGHVQPLFVGRTLGEREQYLPVQ